MKKNLLGLIVFIGFSCAVMAQKAKTNGANEAVASINGVKLPASRLEEVLKYYQQEGGLVTPDIKARMLDDLMIKEVIFQEVTKTGLIKKPESQARLEMAKKNAAVEIWWQNYLQAYPVPESDIRAEYELLVKASQEPRNKKEYNVSQIVVATENQARELLKELDRGAVFEVLAQKSSIHKDSVEQGGLLGWALPVQLLEPLGNTVVSLGKGKVSSAPIQTSYGWHILRLNDVRDYVLPSYDQLKAQIRTSLLIKKRNQAFSELMTRYKVVKF
jgi:peptidyl-prolyl cis-trans isomerase C